MNTVAAASWTMDLVRRCWGGEAGPREGCGSKPQEGRDCGWKPQPRRGGFTIVELLVVLSVIGLLLALLLPAVRTAGEAAKRMSCSNNMKQLGLALANYHDAHGHLPSAMGGTGVGVTPLAGNAHRLSGWVALLPFLEQKALWEQISAPLEADGVTYPAMGPAPWVAEYPPWSKGLAGFLCASARGAGDDKFGRTNYAFCIGDVTEGIHQPEQLRGAFACGMISRYDDIQDGLSHTIALAEIGTAQNSLVVGKWAVNQPAEILQNPSLCLQRGTKQGKYAANVPLGEAGRGSRWADGAAGFGLVNTVLPPNRPSCAVGGIEAVDGVYSAGSFHPGGAHVVMADGAVRFINETIDAGDPSRSPQPSSSPGKSPYGVWGALGTAAGEETIAKDF